ncbi:hypothetical protein [Phormidesmis priestleyi]
MQNLLVNEFAGYSWFWAIKQDDEKGALPRSDSKAGKFKICFSFYHNFLAIDLSRSAQQSLLIYRNIFG